jgi:hypothetical protein
MRNMAKVSIDCSATVLLAVKGQLFVNWDREEGWGGELEDSQNVGMMSTAAALASFVIILGASLTPVSSVSELPP